MLLIGSKLRFPTYLYEVNHRLHQSGFDYARHPALVRDLLLEAKTTIEDTILQRGFNATIRMSTKLLQDK